MDSERLGAAGAVGTGPADPMATDWCRLAWTAWEPLEADAVRRAAPRLPGVYRVRRFGERRWLTYLGQTGRTLRERLLALAVGANADTCPFNDPHTAAPHLWLLRRLEGAALEFSCAPVAGDRAFLRGTEDMLLWRHRLELGAPTEANHGRFYPGYARPTNRWVVRRSGGRFPGRTADPLPNGHGQPRFDLTEPALHGEGGVLDAPWWERLPLTHAGRLPALPAVYCVHDRGADEPAYIGETASLAARAATHAAARWPLREPWLAYRLLPAGTPKHVLRELEGDLLGWHFWRTRRVSPLQYRAGHGDSEAAGGDAAG